jgi:amino acid permease
MQFSQEKQKKLNFLKALATFTGTIIGVGIFGLPYVAMKAGFLTVLIYFIFLAFIVIVVNTLYGEVVCDTHKVARTPGYVEEYIGSKPKKISLIITSVSLFGVLLAYLILGGEFLHLFLSPLYGGAPIIYTLIFFLAGAFFVHQGIKSIAGLQFIILVVFLGILLFFLYQAAPFIDFQNFLTFNSSFLIFPYGIILFSLAGTALIPEVKEMVNRDRCQLNKIIRLGVIIASICYLIFILAFLGASGEKTSENAIANFAVIAGQKIVIIGYLFGLITAFSSFISLGLALKKMFHYDFGVPDFLSWLIVCLVPLGLYFVGFRSFLEVIGITGAVLLGIESLIILLTYRMYLKKRFQRQAPWWVFLIALLFAAGIIIQLFYFFNK